MSPSSLPQKVNHGTDDRSAESIRQNGLKEKEWNAGAGPCGVDEKGFSVSTNPATAEAWARIRAGERGRQPVILGADAEGLPLHRGRPGEWTDAEEFFIRPEDFPKVGPGVFH